MKASKFIALALVLLMLVPLISCGTGEGEQDGTTAAGNITEQTEQPSDSETKYELDIPDVRYDNYTFTIANDGLNTSKYVHNKMTSEGMNGEVINDAIFTRNTLLYDTLGISIEEFNINTASVRNLISSGEHLYDLVTVTLDSLPAIIAYATDFNSIETMNLDMPWWDQNAAKDCLIGDKLLYTYSDAVIYGMDNTRAVYFNQDYHNQLGLEDLYDMVREGKWTIEELNIMAAQAYRDDGDGKRGPTDTYGFTVRAISLCEAMMVSAGISPMQVNDNGDPFLYCYDDQEKFIDVFLGMMNTFNNDGVYYQGDGDAATAFSNGLALFYMGVLKQGASIFRGGELNYGILPLPKYDVYQDRYLCLSPNGHALLIPLSSPDTERTGVILEAMSFYSSAYYSDTALMPSYYTITLQGKTAKDSGSYECLQIIHDNIAYLLKYSGTTLITGLSSYFEGGRTDIASLLKQLEKIHKTALDKFLADIG